MPTCYYCREELEQAEYLESEAGFESTEICTNENCEIQNIVNLYFKPWGLSQVEIEERLIGIEGLTWSFSGKFYFLVTPVTYYAVRSKIVGLCRENGSMLQESSINFVSICDSSAGKGSHTPWRQKRITKHHETTNL
ncbi:hypothetical protein [Paenibacillus illinoisensis]|uniref:hypothetical protein n=1 Tax=Paenibacillus illinoisensis TaxID=59845 RepID=UPI00301CE447